MPGLIVKGLVAGAGFFATHQYATNPEFRGKVNQGAKDLASATNSPAVQEVVAKAADKGEEFASNTFSQRTR